MNFEYLLSTMTDLQGVALALNWPLWAWFVLSALFLFTLLVCLRELTQLLLGVYGLRRRLHLAEKKIQELERNHVDLKERISMLESGVDDFDNETEHSLPQFEISH